MTVQIDLLMCYYLLTCIQNYRKIYIFKIQQILCGFNAISNKIDKVKINNE